MTAELARDHARIVGWLDEPDEARGVRFRRDDGTWWRCTYPDLADRTLRAGAALAEAGVRAGDVVPLMLPNGIEFVTHFFGLLAIGATPSVLPLPWGLRAGERYQNQLHAIASRVRPTHALVTPQYHSLFTDCLAELAEGALVLEPSYADSAADAPRARGELAVLQFTSGSRGPQRGLRITTGNLAANLRMIRDWTGAQDRGGVSWLPMYHDMGLVGGMLAALTVQLEHGLMRPEQFLRDTRGWLTEYGSLPYEFMVMPNFGFERVLARVRPEDLDGLDFSALSSVISGAERIDPAVLSRFAGLLGARGMSASALMPAYGLAEGTLAVTGVPRGQVPWLVRVDTRDRRLGAKVDVYSAAELGTEPVAEPWQWYVSCGRPMAGVEVEIRDEDGVAQPEGVLGEVFVRGDSVADGYTHAGAEDQARLRGGELLTGDAGFLLNGELYVVGRLGDSVKVNGQSVFVEDVELELVASDFSTGSTRRSSPAWPRARRRCSW